MPRYRLTREGEHHYPGLGPKAWYDAADEPDDVGGVQLHVHPDMEQRLPRGVSLRH